MAKTEIVYQDKTLFINLYGTYTIKEIKKLKRKIYNIIDTYGINDIIINKEKITEIDKNAFYNMLDDYDIRYCGNLTVKG